MMSGESFGCDKRSTMIISQSAGTRWGAALQMPGDSEPELKE